MLSERLREDTRFYTLALAREHTRLYTRNRKGKGVRRGGGERLSKSPRCLTHQGTYIAVLRFVYNHLRRGLAHLNLGAHFLDLGRLLFELGNHCLHLVFQLGNGCLLCLDFFVFFEELVEQHHVDVVVADGLGFSFLVQHYQVRIHLCYFFSNQAPTGHVDWVALVVEGHWSKRKDCFTALAHGLDVLLVPSRGRGRTKLVVRVNTYWHSCGANGRTIYTAEENRRASTC